MPIMDDSRSFLLLLIRFSLLIFSQQLDYLSQQRSQPNLRVPVLNPLEGKSGLQLGKSLILSKLKLASSRYVAPFNKSSSGCWRARSTKILQHLLNTERNICVCFCAYTSYSLCPSRSGRDFCEYHSSF